jgi:hypothetical protein
VLEAQEVRIGLDQLRAWLTDLARQVESVIEAAPAMGFTDAQKEALQAEARFYANLLQLYDSGQPPNLSTVPPAPHWSVQAVRDGLARWEQRRVTEGPPLERQMSEDQREAWRRSLEQVRRLRPYAEAYPTAGT